MSERRELRIIVNSRVPEMRILIATDAWHPQVNGVVRTLTSLARSASTLGAEIELPDAGRVSVHRRADLSGPAHRAAEPARDRAQDRGGIAGCHPYRDRRADRLGGARLLPPPQARVHDLLHDALSGIRRGPHRSFPPALGYAVLRHFHAAAAMTMVATASLRQELGERGFRKLGFWTRGVDTELFHPDHPAKLDLPRPIFMTMGRVAVEKNLEAFLSLDLPGTKVVIGDGPQKAALRAANIRKPSSSARRRAGI